MMAMQREMGMGMMPMEGDFNPMQMAMVEAQWQAQQQQRMGMGMGGPGPGPGSGGPGPPGGGGGGMNDGSRPESIFFKTRICYKWKEGNCPRTAERCGFAHGQDDLRPMPSEAEIMRYNQQQAEGGMAEGMGGGGPSQGPGVNQPKGDHQERMRPGGDLHKTRMCTRFKQYGECAYGDRCYYAHSLDELRPPPNAMGMGPNLPQEMVPFGPMGPGFDPFMGPGPGMPGMGGMGMPVPGMMGPMGMGGPGMPGAGMPGGVMPGGGMPRPPMGKMPMGPRPPPGPPPPGHPGASASHPGDRRGAPGGPVAGGRTVTMIGKEAPSSSEGQSVPTAAAKVAPEVPTAERVRALCALLGLGKAKTSENAPAAVQAAIRSLRNGSAFQESHYADGIDVYIRA
ncbi:hypothetical protein WJX72_011302 [[Myrmecia] bisecta]|uniref:C3H1-type domain-containing protein n=1 Tax=[Myrmecia] bisecta TaxID=41462 RepID=A0AAW1P3Y6_9CHLO